MFSAYSRLFPFIRHYRSSDYIPFLVPFQRLVLMLDRNVVPLVPINSCNSCFLYWLLSPFHPSPSLTLYTLIGTKNGGAPNSGSPAFIHPFPSSFSIFIISYWSPVSIQCFQSFISSFKIHIHIEAGEFIAIIQYFMDNKYTPKNKTKNLCYFPTLLYTFSSYPWCKLFFSTSYYSLRDFLLSTNSPQLQSQLKSRLELQSCNQSKPIPSLRLKSSSSSSLSSGPALS